MQMAFSPPCPLPKMSSSTWDVQQVKIPKRKSSLGGCGLQHEEWVSPDGCHGGVRRLGEHHYWKCIKERVSEVPQVTQGTCWGTNECVCAYLWGLNIWFHIYLQKDKDKKTSHQLSVWGWQCIHVHMHVHRHTHACIGKKMYLNMRRVVCSKKSPSINN